VHMGIALAWRKWRHPSCNQMPERGPPPYLVSWSWPPNTSASTFCFSTLRDGPGAAAADLAGTHVPWVLEGVAVAGLGFGLGGPLSGSAAVGACADSAGTASDLLCACALPLAGKTACPL
jgi:hypothetical protein